MKHHLSNTNFIKYSRQHVLIEEMNIQLKYNKGQNMKITWEVEDGYVGKSAPHYTEVPDDKLDDCDNQEEKDQLIEEYIQNDFDLNVTWSIT